MLAGSCLTQVKNLGSVSWASAQTGPAGPGSQVPSPFLLLNQTTQTHLSGSVQQQSREIAAALNALHLIPHIMYLIAHLNGLLLELLNVILLIKEAKCHSWQLGPRQCVGMVSK